jgi:hypothetical protein
MAVLGPARQSRCAGFGHQPTVDADDRVRRYRMWVSRYRRPRQSQMEIHTPPDSARGSPEPPGPGTPPAPTPGAGTQGRFHPGSGHPRPFPRKQVALPRAAKARLRLSAVARHRRTSGITQGTAPHFRISRGTAAR